MKVNLKNNYVTITLAAIALFNVLLHVMVAHNLEYHRDELLYFSLGLHPACGYATVPPLTGWMAWLMQNLFGYSLLAVRIFPALMSGVMIFLVAATARELGGSGRSEILAATGMLVSMIGLRTFLMFQPVYLDLFFWTLVFYLILRFINTSSGRYLILLGVAAGFALLNKYLIGLLFILFLVILPFTQYRNIYRNRNFWYGILACFIIFLPNLIWQITNRLPVIAHLAELKRTQLVNVNETSFLIEQFLMPGAASILTATGLVFLFITRSMRKFRILALTSVAVILALMLLHGKSYYTQGIFPFLMAAGGVAWEQYLPKKWAVVSLAVILILMTIPLLPMGIPLYGQERLVKYFSHVQKIHGMDFVTRFEDNSIHSLPQDYADMLGWEELTEIVDRTWEKIPDKNSAFIYCENYGEAGAVTVIGKKYGLPDPVSFNESFKYWIPKQFNDEVTTLIYVNNEMGEDVKSLFRDITLEGAISNPDAREFGTSVWLCRDPAESFNKFWSERIKEIR